MTALNSDTRVAILARMVKAAPRQALGRTQVMKLFYFLQELKSAPLGYDFRIFNYGPFDSEVLSDLASACGLAAVVEEPVLYPRGYGYAIAPGASAERLIRELEENHPALVRLVDAVVEEFAPLSAAELELRSTILFVDREWSRAGTTATTQEIADRVRQIKPHFSEEVILGRIGQMKEKGWLESLQGATSPIPF